MNGKARLVVLLSLGLVAGLTGNALGSNPPTGEFIRGDCNADGPVTMADAVYLLNYLNGAGTPPGCADACDANNDERLDMADPIRLLNLLFSGGAVLAPPTGTCGTDSGTSGALSCTSHTFCDSNIGDSYFPNITSVQLSIDPAIIPPGGEGTARILLSIDPDSDVQIEGFSLWISNVVELNNSGPIELVDINLEGTLTQALGVDKEFVSAEILYDYDDEGRLVNIGGILDVVLLGGHSKKRMLRPIGTGMDPHIANFVYMSSVHPVCPDGPVAHPLTLDADENLLLTAVFVDGEGRTPVVHDGSAICLPSFLIGECDTEVWNQAVGEATMCDLIMQCATGVRNHGAFVKCVAQLTNRWKKAGLISGEEKGRIESCAARANIPPK